ncbi:3-isopropylmalate dehydratase [Mesorhizobium sp. LjNodule214]|uniref:3-isopropylmalate dehydratase n=1 Tax=Mesorhizobium sp. LjNodule214 TaxID=3342252 RepID=UPI003ECD74A9
MMTLPPISGRAAFVIVEPNFDVDLIIGVSNIKLKDPEELAQLAFADFEPDFVASVKPGDVIVGGENFGYGHPHYPPMIGLRYLGISAVIAESFSPGYWRGEISMGFPQVACPGILRNVRRWERLEVNWAEGIVRNLDTGWEAPFDPIAGPDLAMLEAGGLINYLKSKGA